MNADMIVAGLGRTATVIAIIVCVIPLSSYAVYIITKMIAAAIYDARYEYEKKKEEGRKANGKTER